jgi:hypothetical protein
VLTLFRTNQAIANISLLLYLFILRMSTFIHPLPLAAKNQGILSSTVYHLMAADGFSGHITTVLLIFFQAIMINALVAKYRVWSDTNIMPGAIYALVASILPEYLNLSPILLGNTFLILALYYLCGVYKNQKCADQIFDVGLWIGVASLFQFSFSIFVLWGIAGLLLLRGINMKEMLMFFIGFLVPYILTAVYLFWVGKTSLLWQHHISDNVGYMNIIIHSLPITLVKIGIIGFLLLFIFLRSGSFYSRRNVGSQKYVSLIYFALFAAASTSIVQVNFSLEHLLILAVPVGILLSFAFQSVESNIAEALHTVLFIGVMLMQYEYLLVKP